MTLEDPTKSIQEAFDVADRLYKQFKTGYYTKVEGLSLDQLATSARLSELAFLHNDLSMYEQAMILRINYINSLSNFDPGLRQSAMLSLLVKTGDEIEKVLLKAEEVNDYE